MSNIVSLHPKKKVVDFYEVIDSQGIAVWGGGSPVEAIKWMRMPESSRIIISTWETNELDAFPTGEAIDITDFFKAVVREYGDK